MTFLYTSFQFLHSPEPSASSHSKFISLQALNSVLPLPLCFEDMSIPQMGLRAKGPILVELREKPQLNQVSTGTVHWWLLGIGVRQE